MKQIFLLMGLAVALSAAMAADDGMPDNKIRRLTGAVDTSLVPAVVESKTTKVDATTSRTDSITRVSRLADGTPFPSERSSTTSRQVNPNQTERVTEVSDLNVQGRDLQSRRIVENVIKTPTGEQAQMTEYRCDPSGNLAVATEIAETKTKKPDGTVATESIVKERDFNGALTVKRKVDATTVSVVPNVEVTTSLIQAVDRMTGQFKEIGREVTTTKTTGNTQQSERIISAKCGVSWETTGREVTTDTAVADGSTQRETIEYGKPLALTSGASNIEPLRPKMKTVERYVTQPDGTKLMQRDVYSWGVNGDWVPHRMGLKEGGK